MMGKFEGVFDLVEKSTNSGAGGNTSCTNTVPTGEVWEVLWAMGYHDDAGGNRALTWYIADATDDTVVGAAATVAASVPIYLYDGFDGTNHLHPWVAPLILRAGQYLTLYGAALGANKNVVTAIAVNKLRGAELWS